VSRVDEIVSEFREQRESGPASVYASDVSEAVAVAERLKALGNAHWFRGQNRDWPKLAPTIWRLPPERLEGAKQQFARLTEWAQLTPGLEELSSDPESLLAVAQHYGVPTPFMDFTTEPDIAGFFATDGGSPEKGVESVIICLDVDEARRRWDDVARERKLPVPELLTLDVPNLWRLEAQHGTFVWCPYDSLDAPFRLDRIIFPSTGSYDLPRGDIYPERESPLELLLKQFFQAEANRGGLGSIAKEWQESGVAVHRLHFEDEEYRAEAFVNAPDPHPSWELESIRPWLALDREYWRDRAAGPEVPLEFMIEEPHLMGMRLAILVGRTCEDDPGLRSASPRWAIAVGDIRDDVRELLQSGLQRVWDGMARLPYNYKDIAWTMGITAALILARVLEGDDDAARDSFFASGTVAVHIARRDSRSHACAWATGDAIREAIRDDLEALLVPAERENTFALPFNLLMTARNPRLLFDFDRLTRLFAHQLIPTQVALDLHHPTIFSPARVHVIGPA
jgi:hypothetical protein